MCTSPQTGRATLMGLGFLLAVAVLGRVAVGQPGGGAGGAGAGLGAGTGPSVLVERNPLPGVAQALPPGSGRPGDDRPLVSHQIQLQDIARLEGHGTTILRGIGIVTGLRGTGDSGSEEVLSRPLREIYKNNENPLPDLKSLGKAKAAAIVFLECVVPAQGAHKDDEFPVYVTVSHTASSLAGGRLHLAALSGPFPGQGVYAMASGPIVLEDATTPTSGVIRRGARMIDDITMPTPTTTFNLLLQGPYRRYSTVQAVASVINSVASSDVGDDDKTAGVVATVVDHTMVRVTIPQSERSEPARFVARVLTATLAPELLQPPAIVKINARTGSIIASANVEISPVAIAHKDLQITTVLPEAVPSAQNPRVSTSKWTAIGTAGKASDRAKLQDLLAAFKQLDTPMDSQIAIITELYQSGRLHAELMFE